MGTVRDFKRFLLREAGVESHFEFTERSDKHMDFWEKLNRLGVRNMKSQPPESVPDIDATVQLPNQEWAQLEAEFRQLC